MIRHKTVYNTFTMIISFVWVIFYLYYAIQVVPIFTIDRAKDMFRNRNLHSCICHSSKFVSTAWKGRKHKVWKGWYLQRNRSLKNIKSFNFLSNVNNFIDGTHTSLLKWNRFVSKEVRLSIWRNLDQPIAFHQRGKGVKVRL